MKNIAEEKLLLSTVKIKTNFSLGTGFFIDSSHILTCSHVISGSEYISFYWKGKLQNWKYKIKFNHNPKEQEENQFHWLDIALIEVQCNGIIPPHVIFEKCSPDLGSSLYIFGYPRNQEEGSSSILTYEGNVFNDDYWGDKIYKLRDSRIVPGMSGSPMCNCHSKKVFGIIQSNSERPGEDIRALPIETAVKYEPQLFKLSKSAEQQGKIWIELPIIDLKDLREKTSFIERFKLSINLLIASLFWNFLNSIFRTSRNDKANYFPAYFAWRVAILCVFDYRRLYGFLNTKFYELDIAFINRARYENISTDFLQLQEYVLLELILIRLGSKKTRSLNRISDAITAIRERKKLLNKSEILNSKKKNKKLFGDIRSISFWKEFKVLPSFQENNPLESKRLVSEVIEYIYRWKKNNVLASSVQLSQNIRDEIQAVFEYKSKSMTWEDIELLRQVSYLIAFDIETNNTPFDFLAEAEKYFGFGDTENNRYHWRCQFSDSLKYRFMNEVSTVKSGQMRKEDMKIFAFTQVEHEILQDTNYEEKVFDRSWKRCKNCHDKRGERYD